MANFYTIIVGGQRRTLTRAQLQAYKEGKLFQNADKEPKRTEEIKKNNDESANIEDLRDKYKEKYGKDVPVNKKNDEEWITNKLTN